jgi:hypothetical protein
MRKCGARRRALGSVAVAPLLSTGAQAANLVQNGGFESDTLPSPTDHSDPACFPPEAAIFGAASGNRGSVFIAAKSSDSRAFATTAGGEGSQAGLPNLEIRRASNRAMARAAYSSFASTVISERICSRTVTV